MIPALKPVLSGCSRCPNGADVMAVPILIGACPVNKRLDLLGESPIAPTKSKTSLNILMDESNCPDLKKDLERPQGCIESRAQ